MAEGGHSGGRCSSWAHPSPPARLRTLLLLILAPLAHPALLATPLHCRLSTLVPWRGAAAGSGVVRRARRSLRACAEPEEPTEREPDPDLISAWLDDEKASVLTDGSVPEVEPLEAEQLMSSGAAVLVDLRTPWQFAREFVPGAINVPAGEPGPMGLTFHFREGFADAMAAACPPGGKAVLLVCEFGVVSVVAATRLAEQGYTVVSAVRGGFEAWRLEAQGSIEGAIDEEMPFPEWSEESGGLAMWPVAKAEPPVEEEEAADQGIGFGLDELELGELSQEEEAQLGELEKLFGEALPESDVAAANLGSGAADPGAAAAEGLDALVAELDKPVALPEKLTTAKAKKAPGRPRKKQGDDFETEDAGAEETAAGGEAPAPTPAPAPTAPFVPPLSSAAASLFGDDGDATEASVEPATSRPRASAAASYGGPSRMPRGTKGRARGGLPPAWLVDVSHLDFATLASSGELAALSVKELKSFLYDREGSLSGAKKVLVDRVTDALRAEGQIGGAAGPPAAAPPPVNGAAANGVAANGVAPGSGVADAEEDMPKLGLFDTEGSSSDPQDDFLIDEVFSAM